MTIAFSLFTFAFSGLIGEMITPQKYGLWQDSFPKSTEMKLCQVLT